LGPITVFHVLRTPQHERVQHGLQSVQGNRLSLIYDKKTVKEQRKGHKKKNKRQKNLFKWPQDHSIEPADICPGVLLQEMEQREHV